MEVKIISPSYPDIIDYLAQNARICTNSEDFNANDIDHNKSLITVENLINRGHYSVFESVYVEWYIQDISRATSHQLVRHRVASYLQQSQRYVKYDKNDAFWDAMVLPDLSYLDAESAEAAHAILKDMLKHIQNNYCMLIDLGVRAEDARSILPQCSPTTLKVGMNLREFLFNFYPLRSSKHAQTEIRLLARCMMDALMEKYNFDGCFDQFITTYFAWLDRQSHIRNEWR